MHANKKTHTRIRCWKIALENPAKLQICDDKTKCNQTFVTFVCEYWCTFKSKSKWIALMRTYVYTFNVGAQICVEMIQKTYRHTPGRISWNIVWATWRYHQLSLRFWGGMAYRIGRAGRAEYHIVSYRWDNLHCAFVNIVIDLGLLSVKIVIACASGMIPDAPSDC